MSAMVLLVKFRPLCFLGWLTLSVFLIPTPGHAEAASQDSFVLQLKWKHQFQFAGYYAAEMQGYFTDLDLDVRLVAGGPGISVADEVVSGRAAYGVLASELVRERALGQPVVLLAVIFQHSPRSIIVRADSPIHHPADLVGQPFMLNRSEDAELLAMFKIEGVALDSLNILDKNKTALDKLQTGEIAGMNGSIANQPFTLQKMGVPVRLIRPEDYGIDYIGDSLFTSEHERKENPRRVAAVRDAVLKGWRYALDNPNETITYILANYETGKTREQLLFEAAALRSIILPDLIDLGHISHGRLGRTFDSYVGLNLAPSLPGIEGMIHDPGHGRLFSRRTLIFLALVLVLALGVSGILILFNRQLRLKVMARTSELANANNSLVQEIEDRIKAQEEVAESERLYRSLIESTHAVSFEINLATGRFSYLGPQTQNLFGFPPSHWQTFDDWFESVHSDDRKRAKTYCQLETAQGLDHELEYRLVHADGSLVWVRDVISIISKDGRPFRAVGFMIDITQAKEADAAREKIEIIQKQSQKMEAIGMLAGGIAHDLNNLLLPILGHAEILAEDMSPDDARQESVKIVHSAAEKARDLVRQLLAFGRKQVLEVQPINLSKVIADFVPLLHRTITENITITTKLDDQSLPVRADVGQIEQVVMNLVINAQDAMPDGGRLTIETDLVILDDEYCGQRPEVVPGQYVMMAITDTGSGMDEHTRAHAFEPFFTTKSLGRGTGLGLASIHGIVHQHGGHIWVYSEMGRGTTFKIYFPVLADTAESQVETDKPRAVPKAKELLRGTETLLLVEDDPQVRQYLSRIIERLGYKVHIAADGEEAVAKVDELAGAVDLVLTDVIMPRMSGREVSERVGEMYPEIRFLFMSGYTNNVIVHQGVLDDGVFFIQKPFSREELAEKLRAVLDDTGGDQTL